MITWIYGPPCSGKSTILNSMKGIKLDSHSIREASGNWDLSELGRESNLKSLAAIASVLDSQGYDVCVAAVTPKIKHKELIRGIIPAVIFVLADFNHKNLGIRQAERFGDTFIPEGFEY